MSETIYDRILELVDKLEDDNKIRLSADMFNYFKVDQHTLKQFLDQLEQSDRIELIRLIEDYDDTGEYVGNL